MRRVHLVKLATEGFAHAYAITRPCAYGFIDDAARFFSHAELAGAERGVDVFARLPGERDLEIMNHRRAVHRKRRRIAALDQVNQHRRETRFNDVPAKADDDGALLLARFAYACGQFFQLARNEDVRQAGEEFLE